MTKDRERRLQRLEALYPASQESDDFHALLTFMTTPELRRMNKLMQLDLRDDETLERDLSVIMDRAKERQDRQLTENNIRDLNHLEREKERHHWRLVQAIGRRHPGFHPSADRFDVMDFSVDEIDQLTDVVTRAASPDDLTQALELIEKLRIDGRPVTYEDFVAIIFDARLGQEPDFYSASSR